MMTESQILVFSECGVTRMRSAGDSNEDEWSSRQQEPQRSSLYRRAENSVYTVAVRMPVLPTHCSRSMKVMRKWTAYPGEK